MLGVAAAVAQPLEGFFDVAYYSRHAADFCVLGSILV